MSLDETDGFVWRAIQTLRKIKIPKGYVKCQACHDSGKVRFKYSDPHSDGDFMTCLDCQGKGFKEGDKK